MTMIRDALVEDASFHTYEVSGNSINATANWSPDESFVWTYNSKGQCTVYDWYYDGVLIYKLELEKGDTATISFGAYFVLFALISMISLVLIMKKKHMRVKQ